MAQIRRIMEDKQRRIFSAIELRLQYIGEKFVVAARNTNTYKDQTGNLRSSIGYIVAYNGNIEQSQFDGSTTEGVAKSQELAQEVLNDHPLGFVMICVAGMDYAASVEAKGFDVITNSSLIAVIDLRKMMRDLKQKIDRLT